MLPELSEIKSIRKALNISQKELGEILKIPQSTISRIENGSIDPPYSKIKKIYNYLQKELAKSKEYTIRAENIMTKKIFSISSNSTVKQAVEIMNQHKISQIPIIDDDKIAGTKQKTGFDSLLGIRNGADIAFIGTNGIFRDVGFTTASVSETLTKKAIVKWARQKFIVADPSKFVLRQDNAFASFYEDIKIITTKTEKERRILDEYEQWFKNTKTEIMYA